MNLREKWEQDYLSFVAYSNIDVLVNGEYYNFTGFETLEDMNAAYIDGYEGITQRSST